MSYDESPVHPAKTALFVACCVRGYLLETVDGMYSLSKRDPAGTFQVFASGLSHKDVANLLGAEGTITLRQATERAGFQWPDSAQAFVEAVKKL